MTGGTTPSLKYPLPDRALLLASTRPLAAPLVLIYSESLHNLPL